MILWPIFGSLNQLIACLALLTLTVYLYRSRKPIIFCAVPALVVASIVFCASSAKNGILMILSVDTIMYRRRPRSREGVAGR